MPDIVELGFSFSDAKAISSVNLFARKLDELKEKGVELEAGFSQNFLNISRYITGARESAVKFTKTIHNMSKFAQSGAGSLRGLNVNLSSMTQRLNSAGKAWDKVNTKLASTNAIQPISQAVLSSLQQLSAILNSMPRDRKSIAIPGVRLPDMERGIVTMGNLRHETGLFGFSLKTLIALQSARFFRESWTEAMKFGEELAYITSLTVDYNKASMRKGILDISSVFGNATQNAEAAYYAYSSGVRGGEEAIVSFTSDMAKLAKLIRADIVPTINAATTAMNAYGLTAADSGKLTDLFYSIVKQGRANGQQLAAGLGQVISTSATAGLSLNEMGASIASLTKVMQSRNAITYFNNMLSKMLKPTKEAQLAARKLGIELGLDEIRATGFAEKMAEIRRATMGNKEALLSIFPDLRGQRAALQLLNNGWDDFQKQLKFFENSSGAADEALKLLERDINVQMGAIPNTLNKIKIATGEMIANFATFGGLLTHVVAAFNNMDEKAQKVIATAALLASSYGTLKLIAYAWHSMQANEIRNNQIIAAQRARELSMQKASATASNAEASAIEKTNLAREQQNALMIKEAMARTQVAKENLAKAMQAQQEAATAAQTAAQNRFWQGPKKPPQSLLIAYNASKVRTANAAEALKSAQAKERELVASLKIAAASKAELSTLPAGTTEKIKRLMIENRIAQQEALQRSLIYDMERSEKNRIALIYAENHAMKAQLALQKAIVKENKSSKTLTAFGKLSRGEGFIGGFGRSGVKGLMNWKKALSYSGSGLSGASAGVTLLGTGLGKLANLVVTVFSPTNVLIGGAIAAVGGLIDVLTSKGDTWSEKVSNSRVVSLVGEKLYEFFTGGMAAAQEFDNRMKLLQSTMGSLQKGVDAAFALTNKMSTFAEQTFKKSNPVDKIALLNKQFNDEVKKIPPNTELKGNLKKASDLYKQVGKSWNVTEEIAKAAKEAGVDPRKLQSKIGDSGFVDIRKWYHYLGGNAGAIALAQMYLTKEGKAATIYNQRRKEYLAKQKELGDLNKKNDEQSENRMRDISRALRIAEDMQQLITRQVNALRSVEPLIEQQKVAMMTAEEQFAKNFTDAFDFAENKIPAALKSKNGEEILSSYKGFLDAANKARKFLTDEIKQFDQMTKSLSGDLMDVQLNAAETTADKMEILSRRADELSKQSGAFQDGDLVLGDVEDLSKSYADVKAASELQIRAKKLEIDEYKKLADAERQANENTIKWIQSIDKLSERTAGAVRANSLDALRLQTRGFASVPASGMTFNAQTAQYDREKELRELYRVQGEQTKAFMDEIALRRQNDVADRADLEKSIQDSFEAIKTTADELLKKQEILQTKNLELVRKLEGEKQQLLQYINQNVTTVATAFKNAGVTG